MVYYNFLPNILKSSQIDSPDRVNNKSGLSTLYYTYKNRKNASVFKFG